MNIVEWIMSTKLYRFMVLKVVPKIRFTTQYPKFSGPDYQKLLENLRDGDILLTVDNSKLSSILIPDKWSHAAIYFKGHVYEMVPPKISKTELFDFCKTCDELALLRCEEFTPTYVGEMYAFVCRLLKLEVPYDIMFDMSFKSLYCSELVVYLDFKNYLQVPKSKSFGKEIINPSDLLKANVKRIL